LSNKGKILVTGAAGFIGFHLCKRLISEKREIVGFDNLNSYYDISLKQNRLSILEETSSKFNNFSFIKGELEDIDKLNCIFENNKVDIVLNLAAQAGVRNSIDNPSDYIQSNLVGFGNILEVCRNFEVDQLIYASSSSVYGGNKNFPFKESDEASHPLSLYGATKRSNEIMAHSYSSLYGLCATGLRFFTVYGPWGRPDMALYLFTKAILEDKPINVFNNGNMIRDFTYVDDITESMYRLINKPAMSNKDFNYDKPDPSESWVPHKIFNIGNSSPVPLMEYINAIEQCVEKKAIKNFMPMQDGDVSVTSSDCSKIEKWINFRPRTSIKEGINQFVSWYREYHEI